MTTNYNTKFSEFGEKFFQGFAPLSPEERAADKQALYREFLAEFFEQLLLFDKIAIKIERDNVPLAILINELGLDLVYECVRDGTIELWLWTQAIFITGGMEGKGVDDDSYLKGIPPLSVGRLSSPQHSDPEESIKQCFNWVGYKYSRQDKRRFIQKISYRIRRDEDDFANKARDLIIDAYKANHLANIGLPFIKHPNDLNYQERVKFMDLASDVIDTSFLAAQNYTSFNKYNSTLIAQSSLDKIAKAYKIQGGLNEITKLEKLPDLKSIFLDRKIDFYNAVKFRNKQVSKKFRDWLSTATDSQEIEYITKQYVDELVKENGYFDSKKGKFLKTLSMTTVGAGLGLLGMPGAGVGATIAKGIDFASDLALGSFDAFILDKLGKGWKPRLFMDELRKEIHKFD